MKEIKWGIISTGNIAGQFSADFKYVNNGQLQAVASRNNRKASEFARKFNIPTFYGTYEELMIDPEIDVVYIATPHHLHYQLAKMAMNHGKAVVCEKPLTTTLAHAEDLVSIAKNQQVYLMEAMWMYFLPAVLRAMKWIKEGRIGNIKHLQVDFGFKAPYVPEGRLFNPELAGGVMLDVGIYPLAFAWLVVQGDPERKAVKGKLAPTGVDSDVTILFDYGDISAVLRASLECHLFNHAIVIGDEGMITIPDFWRAKDCLLFQDGNQVDHFQDNPDGKGYYHEINAVNEDLNGGKLESETMPLITSFKFQEHIQGVLDMFRRKMA